MKKEKDSDQMRMNGMTPAGFSYFMDSEIGLTMDETKVEQLPNGTWKASAAIGTIFGADVEGECSGEGPTKDAALEALAKSRKELSDSLWA